MLYIAVSQSGGSPDLVESMVVARDVRRHHGHRHQQRRARELAKAAEFAIDLQAGPERAVAATKTYTAELLALYLLLAGGGNPADAAQGLPEAAEKTLSGSDAVHAAAARYRFASRLVTTGRGYSYPAACEGALKLMETSYLSAHAYSTADLLHGPVAMLGPDVPLIAVVTPGHGGEASRPVVARLRESGVDVLVVGDGDLPVATAGVPEELNPVLEILPLQQLAWRLAIDRGTDPDRPRGLSKVTRTR